MNEKEFGDKVARLLQSSLDNIDEPTRARLDAARSAALSRHVEEAPTSRFRPARFFGERLANAFGQRPLLWAPIIALLLALGIGSYVEYWQNEGEDVDAFLLAGDLPIQAYIDKDFDAWLKGYSR